MAGTLVLKRIAASVFLLLGTICIHAQTGAGRIQGSVTDPTNAVIPKAQVIALHLATAQEFHTEANEAGLYVFPSLQPGQYRLSAKAPGMQSWSGEMVLPTGETAVVDVTLKIAVSATEIVVAGDVTPLVTTANATLGITVEHERIEQLPLNGRGVNMLVQYTVPGIEVGGQASGLRAYGMREGSVEFMQDGAAMYNYKTGTGLGRPPGLDTVDEFRVENNNASAKSNRPAKIIVKTKSGTNVFHGAVFETARNNGLGLARKREDFFEKAPTLIRNEFGLSAGGPIVRNKTFIFGAYERYALRRYTTFSTGVITAPMREGDFSGLVDASGRAYTLYDPWSSNASWTRTPYPNNRIPVSQRSGLATYMFSVTPLPTLPNINPIVGDNLFVPAPNNKDDHTGTIRVDHRLSENNQLFFRYSQGLNEALSTNSNNSAPTTDMSTNYKIGGANSRTLAGSWTHLFSASLFSESMVTYTRELHTNLTGDSTTDYAAKLGLPNPFKTSGFPELGSIGLGLDTTEKNNTFEDTTRIWSFQHNMTKIKGRHEFEFGGQLRLNDLDLRPQEQYTKGFYQFASLATAQYDPKTGSRYTAVTRTGHNAANFFLGVPSISRVTKNRPWFHFNGPEYSGYLQDNWKATSRLTLNLGVRVEAFPILNERDNILTSYDRKTNSIVIGQPVEKLNGMGAVNPGVISAYNALGIRFTTPEAAGMPHGMMTTDLANWEPRIGFAWRATNGNRPVVVRGGFSRFGQPIALAGYQARARNNPPLSVRYENALNTSGQSPDGIVNYLLRNAPKYVLGKGTENLFSPNSPSLGGIGTVSASYYDPYQPLTKVDQWNFTIEREVLHNTIVRAALVGNHTMALDQMYSYNDPMPDYIWFMKTGLPLPQGERAAVARRPLSNESYGTLEMSGRKGWANYTGFQLEAQRRFSKGLAFQIFYVMSNAHRAGGNDWRDDFMQDPYMFLDGAVPQDYDARNRLLNYHLDNEIPKHKVRWNWLLDLPFGKGKALGRNAGSMLNRIIGGWQLAGQGSLSSSWWALPTDYWGTFSNIEIYGKKYPIQDCRSGQCINGYLFYNGYVPANKINSYDANGKPNGVMGVPSSYFPATAPNIIIPKNGGNTGDPLFQYLDTSTVFITLKDGTRQPVTPDTGLHPWRNQYRLGPMNWNMDASLFKSMNITERIRLRFNADFFNVFNMPGIDVPDSKTGIVSLQNSANEPRQLQLTLRLIW